MSEPKAEFSGSGLSIDELKALLTPLCSSPPQTCSLNELSRRTDDVLRRMNRIGRPVVLTHNGKAVAIIHEPAEFFETERRRKTLVQGILTEGEGSGTFPAVRRLGKMFAAEKCKSATRRILQNWAKIEGNKHRLAYLAESQERYENENADLQRQIEELERELQQSLPKSGVGGP